MANCNRFAVLSTEELTLLEEASKNGNTTKSTNTWVRVFNDWCVSRGVTRKMEEFDNPYELDAVLQVFYGELRKRDGNEYEPDCLAVMQSSLDRYLKEKGYPHSIVRDKLYFSKSCDILEGKARSLRMEGKGKRPNATRPLTAEEEEYLWSVDKLGAASPEILLNTIWFLVTQHFGMRARQEHHSMKVENFRFLLSDDGATEIVEFLEDPTKTRNNGLHPKRRFCTPKMFATNDARCPVALLKLFLSKRPAELRNTGPFYLGINRNSTMSSNVCYLPTPMGKNKISGILKSIIKATKVVETETTGRKLANHSARKTGIKKMKKAKLAEDSIIKITGHNSTAGLRAYDEGDEGEFHDLSDAIHSLPVVPTNSVPSNPGPSSSNPGPSNSNHGPSICGLSNSALTHMASAAPGSNIFVNCQVTFNVKNQNKRKMVIYDDSSSQSQE